jgi:hypothetical protein
VTVITNAQGVALMPAFTANGTIGLYPIIASVFTQENVYIIEFTNTLGDPAAVVIAGASNHQVTTVNTPFASALSVMVTDSGNNPLPAVKVTFTAPSSGASGTFPGAALTATATTNASGIATAPAFTANSIAGIYNVTASAGAATPLNFTLVNNSGPAALVAVSAGSGQSAAPNAPFGISLQALVTDAFHNPISGVTVTFAAPNSGASGVFQGPSLNATGITNGFGIASAPPFTANSIAGGPYIVTASVGGVATAANFSLTNATNTAAITIQTSPTGLAFTLDSTVYNAPQTLNLTLGAHTLAVAATVPGAAGTQYVFTSWSDKGAVSHSITVGSSPASFTASFKTQYQLSISASPMAGGTFTPVSPAFYDSGSVVPISAIASSGYAFANWTGSVASSSSSSTTLTISGPEALTANFSSSGTGHPAFFAGEDFLSGTAYYLQFPNSNLFGYYEYVSSSILYHFDMGFEAFVPSTGGQIYFYDFASGHWWYTSPTLFPYLYDFTLNTFIYYFPDTKNAGHYITNPRDFSNLTTGKIFTM